MVTVRALGVILLIGWLGIIVFSWIYTIHADYEWNDQIYSQWTLELKASTITEKLQYVNQFYNLLASSTLAANDAYIFPTPNNSSAQNMQALANFRDRLTQISSLDPSSFEYQTAMQELPSDEQDMVTTNDVLRDTWIKANYPFAYIMGFSSLRVVAYVILMLLFFVGVGCLLSLLMSNSLRQQG